MRTIFFASALLVASGTARAFEPPRQIAISGQIFDGQAGRFTSFPDAATIGGHDTIPFKASTSGRPYSPEFEIFKYKAGNLAPLVPLGSPVPGQPGLHFKNTEEPIVASDDVVGFGADFDLPINSFFYDGLFTTL